MSDPASSAVYTAEDVFRLPDDGFRYELTAGFLVREPPAGIPHALVLTRVAYLIEHHREHVDATALVASDGYFLLHRRPDTLRAPDVAVVRRTASWAPPGEGAFPGHPELAIEILSPSNTWQEMRAKVADYLAAGTRAVWVLDPVARSITVYESLLAPRVLTADEELDGAPVLPGFRRRVAEFFVY